MWGFFVCLSILAFTDARPSARYRASVDWNSSPFVINGGPAARGRWPWQLSLEVRAITGFRHTCGASLVTPTKALTAAHCTYNRWAPGKFRLVLGAFDRDANDEEEIIKVTNRVEHEKFSMDSNGFPYDVCILTLEKPATLNQYVKLATLASKGEDFVGQQCFSTGWGKLRGEDTILPKKLQQVEIDVLSKADCIKNTAPEEKKHIFDEHICIWGGSENPKGVCSGDSGGPLNCRKPGAPYKVCGVASWVVGVGTECKAEFPSVYARVSYYRDWIDKRI